MSDLDPKVPSYWKSKNYYDPDLTKKDYFKDTTLVVEEKIDGSQFSFGYCSNIYGAFRMVFRSKNVALQYGAADNMFGDAIRYLYGRNAPAILPKNVVFRCEYVRNKKHNKLTYDRIPSGCLVMFGAEDLATGKGVGREVWSLIAREMGIDVVHEYGTINTRGKSFDEVIKEASVHLGKQSMLGGSMIEGVVLKRVSDYIVDQDGTPIYAKIVGDEFREIARIPKKTRKCDTQEVIIQHLIDMVQKDAIYSKAVQHLLEDGKLEGSNKDIGPLIVEVQRDIATDMEEPAKTVLWEWAKDQVVRGCVKGFATWYQARLKRLASDENVDAVNAEPVGEDLHTVVQEAGTPAAV